ncbi:putative YTH domain-containing protein [Rosa chinensis]|uniref:YTH domain-containing family protein n=1 Tax=Rosa chinensis TaxID=74649 RepID=A0A2P6P7J8_ROSCH|nr:YTH domain-containing protein 1 [Rosa chinensis]XP_040368188.1 YTH domain-containing protein 1 [Rosa chinensis]PRQ17897.1 putative YTH domain-containing protein [Rosa chinensis]
MSCDTAKEIASVVDSSVTERKEDMGNSDEPESSSHKVPEGVEPCRSDEVGHSHDHVGDSPARKKGKLYGTRYFIIKSLSHENIQLSIEKGIWATQVMNEPILEDAFHNSGKVILIFSVNMSGFFQGYAQMMSSVGWRRDNVWSQGTSRSNPWGRSFKVKWLRLNDLPFQQTLHLKNPLNEYKPVKISRDCQELSPDVGEALCELLDRHNDLNGLNRPCVEPPCSVGEKEYNMPVHLSWSQTPMLYPSMLYQQQPETKRFHLANQKSTDSRPASVLTEDDFLEMSYEEYLEVYGRSRKELYQPGSRSQKSSRSKMQEDDLNSSYGGNLICSRKRAHQSSHKQSQC